MSTTAVMNREDYISQVPTFKAAWLRRVGSMVLLWLVFGAIVGAGIARPGDGADNLTAGVLAGMIVLLPIGIFLGLVGGRWTETAIGAAVGQLIGLAASTLGVAGGPAVLITTGLIFGGLVGSTLVGVFYRLPRILFQQMPVT